jgi:NAD+ diphosphatase
LRRCLQAVAGYSDKWHQQGAADQDPDVRPIPASRPNVYTGSPIDRVSEKRDDAAFIEAASAAADARVVPVWRARSLVRGLEEGAPEAVYLTGDSAASLRAGTTDWAFLGLHDGVPVFAVDLGDVEDPLPLLPAGLGTLTDIRATAGLLPRHDAAVLAHARGLLHWRSRHRFCGVCGGACVPRSAGNAMACTRCNTQHFPRTDPAVIMLVTDGARALLGHSQRFPNSTMYSTLAGFLEPGESLEEAVAREVFEEAGIRTGRVFYHSSQPWPFPASIMLGFHAEALTTDITIDPGELRDARWFSRDEIRNHDQHGFSLPRADSIARRLIEDWMESA